MKKAEENRMSLDKILTKENIDIGILSGTSLVGFPVSILEISESIKGFLHNSYTKETATYLGVTGLLELGAVGLFIACVYDIYKEG